MNKNLIFLVLLILVSFVLNSKLKTKVKTLDSEEPVVAEADKSTENEKPVIAEADKAEADKEEGDKEEDDQEEGDQEEDDQEEGDDKEENSEMSNVKDECDRLAGDKTQDFQGTDDEYWQLYDKHFNKCFVKKCRSNKSIVKSDKCQEQISAKIIAKCQKPIDSTDEKENLKAFLETGKCYEKVCNKSKANKSTAICKLHVINKRSNKIFSACPKYGDNEESHKAHNECLAKHCSKKANKDLPMCI